MNSHSIPAMFLALMWASTALGSPASTGRIDGVPIDLDSAEPAEPLSSKEIRYLSPHRTKQEGSPHAQVDYTAYTLEWGEVKLGFTSFAVGILPRVQVSTVPLLNLVGLYNVGLKANPVRLGPVDISLQGSGYYLPLGEFQGWSVGGGVMTSVKTGKVLSLHVGAEYRYSQADGLPTKAPPLVQAVAGDSLDLASLVAPAYAYTDDPHVKADSLLLRFALDVKLNKRDSLILQAYGVPYGQVRGHLSAGQGSNASGVYRPVNAEVYDNSSLSVFNTYSVSLSWQFQFGNVDVRLGGGYSAVPWVWAVQANDVAFRAGGRSRKEQRQLVKAWRQQKPAPEAKDDENIAATK